MAVVSEKIWLMAPDQLWTFDASATFTNGY